MNKSKLVQRTIEARKLVRNKGVTLLVGDQTELVNVNNMRLLRNITKSEAITIANAMTEFKHEWSVLLCVFGRDETGEEYIKTLDVSPGVLCYSEQIHESVASVHEELITKFNPNHLVNVGWLATPNEDPFNEDKVKGLFTTLNAWDNIAPWEQDA